MKRSMKKFMAMLLAVMMVMGSFSTVLAVSATAVAECAEDAHVWEKYSEKPVVEPTCDEPGFTWYKCSVCEKVDAKDFQPALGHSYVWGFNDAADGSDCREMYEYCENCGQVKTSYGKHSIRPVGVLDGHWADCEHEGYMVYECVSHENCTAIGGAIKCALTHTDVVGGVKHVPGHELPAGYIYVKIDKMSDNGNHSYVLVENIEPNCATETDGYKKYECSVCYDWYSTTKPYGETHDWETKVENCVEYKTCKICGETSSKVAHEDERTTHIIDTENKTCYDETKCHKCNTVLNMVVNHIKTETVNVTVSSDVAADRKCAEITNCLDCGAEKIKGVEVVDHRDVVIQYTEDATCSKWGHTGYACRECGAAWIVSEAPKGHDDETMWETTVTKNPTCTNPGWAVVTCKSCGEQIDEHEVPALGHDYKTESFAATCIKGGYDKITCSRCDYLEIKETSPIDEDAHDRESYKVTTDPTCTKEGVASLYCRLCDEVDVHITYENAVAHHPNFDANKLLAFDHVYSAYPEYKHNGKAGESAILCDKNDPTQYKAPTCAENGYEIGTCALCGYQTTKTLTFGEGHSDPNPVVVDTNPVWADGTSAAEYNGWLRYPSCTQDGLKWLYCSVCDSKYAQSIEGSKLNHNPEKTTDGKAPTCTEAGCADVYECTRTNVVIKIENEKFVVYTVNCDSVTYKFPGTDKVVGAYDIPATGHTPVETLKAQKPTCTEPGWTAEISCSVCGEVLTESEPVDALGHDWQDVDAKPATCTDNGYTAHKVCGNCGEKDGYTELVALGHVRGEQSTKFPPAKIPTCTEDGYTFGYECTRCGGCAGYDVVKAYGHNYVTDTRVVDCTNYQGGEYHYYAGVMGYGYTYTYCEWCGASDADAIADMDYQKHDMKTITVEAGCVDDGYTVDKCQHAGCGWEDEASKTTISAIGSHDIPNHLEVVINQKEVYCNRCGELVNAHGDAWQRIDVTTVRELQENGACRKSVYELWACVDCSYKQTIVHSVEDTTHEYEAVADGYVAPTYTTTGIQKYECGCGHSYEETLPTKSGVTFKYDVTSYNPNMDAISKFSNDFAVVNGGYLAIRVTVDSNKIELWGAEMVVTFDADKLEFVNSLSVAESADNGFINEFNAVDGKLKVYSYVSANEKINTTLSGEGLEYVDLIFKVKSDVYARGNQVPTEFGVVEAECKLINAEGTVLTAAYGDIESINIQMSGDLNKDGVIDVKDSQIMMDMIVSNALYTSVADLNGDGIVWVDDFGVMTSLIKYENLSDNYAEIIEQAKFPA